MRQVGDMELFSLEEVKDQLLGKVGTKQRDEHERKVSEALDAYRMGEAIKAARLQQKLTQEQLGERIGVKKSQISKLESGRCTITLPTMSRVFKALGFATASLDLGTGTRVPLW